MPNPGQVPPRGPDEPLGAAVALRLTDERRRAPDAEERHLGLEKPWATYRLPWSWPVVVARGRGAACGRPPAIPPQGGASANRPPQGSVLARGGNLLSPWGGHRASRLGWGCAPHPGTGDRVDRGHGPPRAEPLRGRPAPATSPAGRGRGRAAAPDGGRCRAPARGGAPLVPPGAGDGWRLQRHRRPMRVGAMTGLTPPAAAAASRPESHPRPPDR